MIKILELKLGAVVQVMETMWSINPYRDILMLLKAITLELWLVVVVQTYNQQNQT